MRKGHGSTKVPNVKLRPAPPKAPVKNVASSSKRPAAITEDEEPSELPARKRVSEKPFANLYITMTGVIDKGEMTQMATALGAGYEPHLTDITTHLLATEPGSAKYRVSLERRIVIMSPEWVRDSHRIWLEGGSVDLKESIRKHRLPIFSAVRVSVTGVPLEDRQRLANIIAEEKGTYMKAVTKNDPPTHLLCGPDVEEDAPKVKWAKGHNESRNGNKVWVLWDEWFWDCVAFGGRFPEEEYEITKPRPKRKMFVPPPPPKPTTSTQPTPAAPIPSTSILEVTDVEEVAPLPPSQASIAGSAKILEGIFKCRKDWKISDGKMLQQIKPSSTVDLEHESPSLVDVKGKGKALDVDEKPALQRIASRSNAFDKTENRERPMQRVNSIAVFGANKAAFAPPKIFENKAFVLLGEAKAANVIKSIVDRGGNVVLESEMSTADFIVERLSRGAAYSQSASDTIRKKIRTECWLEQCLYTDTICDPQDHPLFKPLQFPLPFPGADKLVVNVTGLEAEQFHWVKRVVNVIGGSAPDKLTRKSTHLICASESGPKYEKAIEWGVKVVDIEWLWNIVRTGSLSGVPEPPPLEKSSFEISSFSLLSTSTLLRERSSGSKESDAMADITNDQSSHSRFDSSTASSSSKGSKPLARTTTALDEEDMGFSFGSAGILNSSSPKRPRLEPSASSSSFFTKNAQGKTSAPVKANSTTTGLQRASTVVPSSMSPSPHKLAQSSSFDPSSSKPPSRSDSGQKMLKHTLTDLLVSSNAGDDSPATENDPRPSKRARPGRVKSSNSVFSSSPTKSMDRVFNFDVKTRTARSPVATPAPPVETSADGEKNESMLITYEDPSQNVEKERLLNLLQGKKAQSPSPPKASPKAKSTSASSTASVVRATAPRRGPRPNPRTSVPKPKPGF